MRIRHPLLRLFVATALGMPFIVGCGGGTTPTDPDTAAQPAGESQAQSASSRSTANQPLPNATVIATGEESAPAQTVAIFLDSLRRGDEQAANGVLTRQAQAELAKTDYVIEPLGTPEGKYKIGRVGFPYEEKDVALVECTWTEPATEEMPEVTMDIVCEVHEEAEGWRISGIGLSIPGIDQTVVLDFENASALQATIDAATGQPPRNSQPQQQVAGQQGGSNSQPSNFPSYPSLPSGGVETNAAANTEIALPPITNAPVNR